MPRRAAAPPPDVAGRPRRTRDLRAAGVSKAQLEGLRWSAVFRGVHAFETERTDPRTRILAAAELMPATAAIGGWAALHLLRVGDLDGRTGPGAATLLPVPVCTGPAGRMAPRPGLAIDRGRLPEVDVTEVAVAGVGRIRVTVAARACVDIARRHGTEEGVVAGDAAVRFGVVRREQVQAYVRALGRVPGIPSARAAADLIDGRAESCPESRLRYVWTVEAGLPAPLVNPDVINVTGGFRVARADLLDPEAATVGEYDGRDHRSLAQHAADNAREEALERLNLTVVRATALDLWPRRAELVARLRAAHRDGLARDRSRDRWAFRR